MKTADLIWLGQRLTESARLELKGQALNVSPAEVVLMRDLLDNPPSTITALVARTGYAQSRVSTAVVSMVGRGWVGTRSDPADARRTLVFVPDHVRKIAFDRLADDASKALDHVLAGRPPARRKAIVAALEELLEAYRQHAAEEQRSTATSPGSSRKRARAGSQAMPPG